MSTAIVRSLIRTGLRFGRLALLYLAGLAVLALVPVWSIFDTRIDSALIRAGPQPRLHPSIVPVDLPWGDGADSAGALLALLQSLERADPSLAPRTIVIDLYFDRSRAHRDPRVLAKLGAAIAAMRARRTKVYVAVDPSGGSANRIAGFWRELAPEIYDNVTRAGHTRLSALPSAPGALMFAYRTAIRVDGSVYVYAMPLVVQDDLSEPLDRYFPFLVGEPSSFNDARRTPARASAHPEFLSDKNVLIGTTSPDAGDTRSGRPGMEIVAWALTERLTAGTNAHVALYANRAVLVGFTLLLSLLAVAAFASVFRLLRPRRISVPAATAAAAVVPLAMLALVVGVLAWQHVIYLQTSFELAGVLLAAAVCTRAGHEQLRRDLLLGEYLGGRRHVERKYDVFVSYSRDDENMAWVEANVVAPLRAARDAEGKPLAIFFDRETIRQGFAWYESILDAFSSSGTMIAVYTKRYFERPMCTEELLMAMRRRVEDDGFKILPLSRVAGDVPRRFSGFHYLDVVQSPDYMEQTTAAVVLAKRAPVPPSPVAAAR